MQDFLRRATESRYGIRAPTPTSVASDQDELLDLDVPTPPAELEASHSLAPTRFSKSAIPPDIQQVFRSALDDRPYKSWKGA